MDADNARVNIAAKANTVADSTRGNRKAKAGGNVARWAGRNTAVAASAKAADMAKAEEGNSPAAGTNRGTASKGTAGSKATVADHKIIRDSNAVVGQTNNDPARVLAANIAASSMSAVAINTQVATGRTNAKATGRAAWVAVDHNGAAKAVAIPAVVAKAIIVGLNPAIAVASPGSRAIIVGRGTAGKMNASRAAGGVTSVAGIRAAGMSRTAECLPVSNGPKAVRATRTSGADSEAAADTKMSAISRVRRTKTEAGVADRVSAVNAITKNVASTPQANPGANDRHALNASVASAAEAFFSSLASNSGQGSSGPPLTAASHSSRRRRYS